MSRLLTRRDVAIIVSIVAATVTSMWAGIQFVDGRFEEHGKHVHDNAVSRNEFVVYNRLILDRLTSIDKQLESIRSILAQR